MFCVILWEKVGKIGKSCLDLSQHQLRDERFVPIHWRIRVQARR